MRRAPGRAAHPIRPLPVLLLTGLWVAACGQSSTEPDAADGAEPFDGPTALAHGNFGQTAGVYRIPYGDGITVGVTNDVHNHNNAFDMSAGVGEPLVAAASGWIRGIVEHHGNDPNPGDGLDALGNPYMNGPAGDSLEHACLSNDPSNTVPAGTSCSDYNNYVWIEHPNGEYTKYSHVGTGTVSDNGWSEGDWIDAGDVIGLENDPGAASCGNCDPDDRAFHLHWEVAVSNTPGVDLTWTEAGGFIQNGARVPPVICDIAGNQLLAGNSYTADPCEHEAPTADAGGPYTVDEGSMVALDGTGSTDPDGNPLTYLWEPASSPPAWSLDDHGIAEPTFGGRDDMVVDLTLNVYDQIEALRATAASTVTVENVAPTVALGPDQVVTSGADFDLVGDFSDPGVVDNPWTFSIDWGDGSATTDGATDTQATPVMESHAYCAAGSYMVSMSVTDKDGGEGSDDLEVTVDFFSVTLDVKPGGSNNPVNLSGRGVIPMAILSTADFDATAIDPSELRFGDGMGPDTPLSTKPNGTYHMSTEDVDGDGADDLVVHVRVNELVANGDLTPASTVMVVRGFLDDGCTNFGGQDAITIVP